MSYNAQPDPTGPHTPAQQPGYGDAQPRFGDPAQQSQADPYATARPSTVEPGPGAQPGYDAGQAGYPAQQAPGGTPAEQRPPVQDPAAKSALPDAVATRLHGAAEQNSLGEFRRIVEINESSSPTQYLAFGIAALLGGLALIFLPLILFQATGVRLLLIGIVLVILGPYFLYKAYSKNKTGRQWIGVYDFGMVSTHEKQNYAQVIRYQGAQAETKSSWINGNAGRNKRAQQVKAAFSNEGGKLEMTAKTDDQYREVNDLLQRCGQQPVLRIKEPKYTGK